MIETKMMQDKIDGMIERGKKLREDEAIFTKAQGIDETIIKTQNENAKNLELLADEKENLKTLKEKKKKAVSGAKKKIEAKMNEVLPLKNAIFDCTDGLIIGMVDNGSILRYNSLSGGQKQEMDAALSNVLDANIIVIEGAELDSQRTGAMLEDLANIDKQIIFNTCLPPKSDEWPNSYGIPKSFELVELKDIT